MEYRVELDVYNGPLDLLLYLIKRDELDIYDIPITRILDTYMTYVEMLKRHAAGKRAGHQCRGRFPGDGGDADGNQKRDAAAQGRTGRGGDFRGRGIGGPAIRIGPAASGIQANQGFGDSPGKAADGTRAALSARPPAGVGAADEPPPLDLDEVQIWDLLDAFSRLMKEVGIRGPRIHEVIYDDTPIDLHAADIEDRLNREGKLSLRALVVGRASRSEMIGVFLALLELIRQKKILVFQGDERWTWRSLPAPEEHRNSYVEASPTPPPLSEERGVGGEIRNSKFEC